MVTMQKRWPLTGLLIAGLMLLGNNIGIGEDKVKDKEDPMRAELLKLNQASTEETQTAQLRALVKDREKAKKAVVEAVKMMKEAKGEEKPFNLNGTTIIARVAHIVHDYDAADRFYDLQLDLATKVKSGSKMMLAYEGMISLYFDAKRYADVVDLCEKVMDSLMTAPKDVQDSEVVFLESLVQAKAKQGKADEALRIAQGLVEATPAAEQWYFLRLKGWVQREVGKLDNAIDTYTEVLDKLDASKTVKGEKKDKLKDTVRYILSGLYVENKDIDKAAKQLETLIKRNPDSATYKNDLGFIWCDNDLKLEESEKLIKEALDLDKKEQEKALKEKKIDEVKENAAYLDSLGWVYFKQKKYKEALEPLKKASIDEDEGAHLEIWDHLADCYMALNQKKDAIASWEKALKMEDLSKRDAERRRKVTEKLKAAKADKD
jgi:tetratricopeptide (TPR) repeat protein